MKRMRPVLCLFAVACVAALLLACPTDVPYEGSIAQDDLAAVIALSSPLNPGSLSNTSLLPEAARIAVDIGGIGSADWTINGPDGGSAVFSYDLLVSDESGITMTGSIAYSDFMVSYEGNTYTINGEYDLVYVYELEGTALSLTLTQTGSISIGVGDLAPETYTIALGTVIGISDSTLTVTVGGIVNGGKVEVQNLSVSLQD